MLIEDKTFRVHSEAVNIIVSLCLCFMFYFDEVHGRMRLDNADASLCLRRPSLRMREDHLSNDSCTAAN